MQPSNKISLKYNRDLADNIAYNADGIPSGTMSNISLETTLPFVSEAQFAKLDYNIRGYYDMYVHSRGYKSSSVLKYF